MISALTPGRRSATAICIGALLMAASACGSASRSHTAHHTTTATWASRTVHISGYSITTRCTGPTHANGPAIVLLSGLTEPLSTFAFIQSRLSHLTEVCSYDRLGEGTSSPPRARQTLADSAAILHRLLARLGVTRHGVVLVGHSVGGLIAAKYASQYRTSHQVKALVLLDATPPSLVEETLRLIPAGARGAAGQYRRLTAGFRSGENQERLVLTGAPVAPIGNVPLIVVQHGRPIFAGVTGYGRQLQAIWSQGQRAWLRLSPHSRMVIARNSGHPIYLDQPSLTLQLIRQGLSEAR